MLTALNIACTVVLLLFFGLGAWSLTDEVLKGRKIDPWLVVILLVILFLGSVFAANVVAVL